MKTGDRVYVAQKGDDGRLVLHSGVFRGRRGDSLRVTLEDGQEAEVESWRLLSADEVRSFPTQTEREELLRSKRPTMPAPSGDGTKD